MNKTKNKEKTLSIQHVLLSVLPLFVFRIIYEKVFPFARVVEYFCIPSFRRIDALIFPLLIVFFLINIYGRKNFVNTVYKTLVILGVLITMYMSLFGGVFMINSDGISYYLIPGIELDSYAYTDIESSELYIGISGWKSYNLSLIYELEMTNGDEIVLNIAQSYYENNNGVMEFDKKVSSKRNVIQGEYGLDDIDDIDANMSVESYNYFHRLFDNN